MAPVLSCKCALIKIVIDLMYTEAKLFLRKLLDVGVTAVAVHWGDGFCGCSSCRADKKLLKFLLESK
jgi:hypothetical protein